MGATTVFFLLCIVMSAVIINAEDYNEEPNYRRLLAAKKKILKKYLERKALGGSEIIPLQINGRNISEDLRDLMEIIVIDSLGLPSDYYETWTAESSAEVSKRSGASIDEVEIPEKTGEGFSNPRLPRQVGSIRGIPGVHFPDYKDIPITSFSCADKPHLPGFYADLDTGCQVFHVCWSDRRETFLCPMGTTFNQPLLACDYWYSSNCSLAPQYYNVNKGKKFDINEVKVKDDLHSMIDDFLGSKTDKSVQPSEEGAIPASVLSFVTQFMPVKAKVTVYPESGGQPSKIVASASVGRDEKLTRKVKSSKGKTSNIQATSPGDPHYLSKYPFWCFSYRHFAYRLDERIGDILDMLKNIGLMDDSLEMVRLVSKVRELLWYIDPDLYLFDYSKADYDIEKRIQDVLNYLSIHDFLPKDGEIIEVFDDYGLTELIRHKIKKFLFFLNPDSYKFMLEESNATDKNSEDNGVWTNTPVSSKPVKVQLCERQKCKPLSRPTFTPLNPRFIKKPLEQEQVATFKSKPSPLIKTKENKAHAKTKFLVSSSSKAAVSEETKKALLLNYMRKLLEIDGKKSS